MAVAKRRKCRAKLTDSPRAVKVETARRLVARHAGYFALSIRLDGGRTCCFDVSRRTAARFVRRVAERHGTVPMADLFGSLVLGG
jgi:hypothetical protein